MNSEDLASRGPPWPDFFRTAPPDFDCGIAKVQTTETAFYENADHSALPLDRSLRDAA